MRVGCCYLVFSICLFSVLLAAGDGFAGTTVQQQTKRAACAKDRSGALYCQRVAPPGRPAGHEGVYTEKSEGKVCKWKCKTEQGIETCQASGSECSGKMPPHWR